MIEPVAPKLDGLTRVDPVFSGGGSSPDLTPLSRHHVTNRDLSAKEHLSVTSSLSDIALLLQIRQGPSPPPPPPQAHHQNHSDKVRNKCENLRALPLCPFNPFPSNLVRALLVVYRRICYMLILPGRFSRGGSANWCKTPCPPTHILYRFSRVWRAHLYYRQYPLRSEIQSACFFIRM